MQPIIFIVIILKFNIPPIAMKNDIKQSYEIYSSASANFPDDMVTYNNIIL